jgi:hypothetical protein
LWEVNEAMRSGHCHAACQYFLSFDELGAVLILKGIMGSRCDPASARRTPLAARGQNSREDR